MLDVQKAAAGAPYSLQTRSLAAWDKVLPVPSLNSSKTSLVCTVQVGLAVGSIGLSAAILLSSVHQAHAVTPEQLLFLEVRQLCFSW